ncbi:MAG: YdcF family protein [Pyrinomonadaceae bacterium]|jgi:vancomycin permeability regulator SanA|nr:YdcF family protein [Pyrinomonadaceae bacterium]
MKLFWRILLTLIIVPSIGIFIVYLINLQVASYSKEKIYKNIADVSNDKPVGIVLGAKVWDDGSLSHVLIDRVTTGVELYKAGKVKKLLMSGDNPSAEYDEPTAMKGEAIKQGVPEKDIVLDFAGRRTYDTCYRAKEIFDVQKAVIVSQEFHLPRSIYLCENIGVESVGVVANRRKYLGEDYWGFREFFSVFSAWFEMNFIPFEPIKGNKEPIIIE